MLFTDQKYLGRDMQLQLHLQTVWMYTPGEGHSVKALSGLGAIGWRKLGGRERSTYLRWEMVLQEQQTLNFCAIYFIHNSLLEQDWQVTFEPTNQKLNGHHGHHPLVDKLIVLIVTACSNNCYMIAPISPSA